jgi:hypothetical protein
MARRFLKVIPTPIVGGDLAGEFSDEAGGADPGH